MRAGDSLPEGEGGGPVAAQPCRRCRMGRWTRRWRGAGGIRGVVGADDARSVVAEPGLLSMFNLAGGQRLPRNAWLNFSDCRTRVGQEGKAMLFLSKEGRDEREGSGGAEQGAQRDDPA